MADRYSEMRDRLPTSYVSLVEADDGWEGNLGDEIGYVILWSPASIQERWEAYEMERFLGDDWFPFGSDGGGEMLCFDLRSGTESVYWIPYIGMSGDDALLKWESFTTLATAIAHKGFSAG